MRNTKKPFPIFAWAQNKQNPSPISRTLNPQLNAKQTLHFGNPGIDLLGMQPANSNNESRNNATESQKLDIESHVFEDGKRKKVVSHKAKQGKTVPDQENIIDRKNEEEKAPKRISSAGRTKYYEDPAAQDQLTKAYEAYQSGNLLPNGKKCSIRNVADYWKVKPSTLATRTNGKISVTQPPRVGRKSFFTKEELQQIVNHLLVMADLGYGYTELQAMNLIRYLSTLKDKEKVKKFKGSHGFMCHLFLQFPELKKRRAQSLEYLRATTLTVESIQHFFTVLGEAYTICKELSQEEIHPKNIWAIDEVGFRLSDCAGYYILAKKGKKTRKPHHCPV